MTPSIETRIKAIAGALEHLILPALTSADSIVQEQASLALGHLKIIEMQLPHVETHHAVGLIEELLLADQLGDAAEGGAETIAAAELLADAAAAAREDESRSARERRNEVAAATSKLTIASSIDGSSAFRKASHDILIEYAFRQTRRDRAWYGPTGLDPFAAGLPSISEIAAEERAMLKAEVA